MNGEAWGIDFYSSQPQNIDHIWQMRDAGMTFAIVKCTMGFGDEPSAFLNLAAQEIKAAGLLFGMYGWIDPTGSVSNQLARYKALIDKYNPDFVCGDYEQWWSDWDDYWRMLRGEISGSLVPVVNKTHNSNFGRDYMHGLAGMGKPAFLYTAKWFIDAYVASPEWMTGYQLWEAAYWNKNKDKIVCQSYDDLYNLIARVPEYAAPTIAGFAESRLWQWSSAVTLPNMPAGMRTDLNFYHGKPAQMRTDLAGVIPVEEPKPGIVMTVMVDSLNVRNGPGIANAKIGALTRGATVTVSELRFDAGNWWAQIGDGRWCAMEYGGQQYLA